MEKIPKQRVFHGKRIVLYGPESTGKSTLSRKLAQHHNTTYIEEFARKYLQDKYDYNQQVAEYEDILSIAIGHRKLENAAIDKATDYLFCDTDVLETYVYSMAYFNKVPEALEEAVLDSFYDLYLLADIDIPWVADDLRDRPQERELFYQKFENALHKFDKPYRKISGLGNERFKNALEAIASL